MLTITPRAGEPSGPSDLSVSHAPEQTMGRGDATLGVMDALRTFTAAIHQEEDWYVAQCLEVDVASQGRSIPESLSNLAEAVELYLDEVDDPQQHVTATPLLTSFQVPGAA
ncbi:MAG: type II toxin-antitoxin system HicB family antitoxin [Pseudonocardiaceae bacterium]